MGYYTDFTLSFEAEKMEHERLYAIGEAIESIPSCGFEGWSDAEWFCNAKWYDREEDMWALSVQFPEVLFVLHGAGDASDDVWDEYWQNGSMQHCHMEIPPYDATKMRPYDLNSKGQLTPAILKEAEEEQLDMDLIDL